MSMISAPIAGEPTDGAPSSSATKRASYDAVARRVTRSYPESDLGEKSAQTGSHAGTSPAPS